VQELVVPDIRLVGLHASEVSRTGVIREIATGRDDPLYEAVTDPLWFTVKAPARRVNAAELLPAATAASDGAVSKLLTVDTTTFTPPAGAVFVRVTVQALDAFGPRLVGLQASEETRTEDERLMVVLTELALYVAIMVEL
jgi:hypothetical protein